VILISYPQKSEAANPLTRDGGYTVPGRRIVGYRCSFSSIVDHRSAQWMMWARGGSLNA
jgi:hypothetical protein